MIQFRGCVMDEMFRDVNQATTRVLKANGFTVEMPSGQGCCGALHDQLVAFALGLDDQARPLLAPDAVYFLRTNLSLQLQAARLALLRGDVQEIGDEAPADFQQLGNVDAGFFSMTDSPGQASGGTPTSGAVIGVGIEGLDHACE